MSIDSAKAFIERVKTDEEFAKRVSECKDAEERMAFAKQEGFNFSPDELMSEVRDSLSDEEIDMVAGGLIAACRKNPIYY